MIGRLRMERHCNAATCSDQQQCQQAGIVVGERHRDRLTIQQLAMEQATVLLVDPNLSASPRPLRKKQQLSPVPVR